MKRFLVMVLAFCSLANIAQSAWQVSYSASGSTTVNRYNSPDPDETGTFIWNATTNGGSGGGLTGVVAPGRSTTFGSVTTAGTVTATATWVPEPNWPSPPEVVVIEEIGESQWNGLTGSASDGLGHPIIASIDPNNPGGTSAGSKYSVRQNPGASFTITCSLSASCDVPRNNAIGIVSGSASCTYAVAVHTPRLLLEGVTATGKIIAGQAARAKINLDGIPSDLASRYNFNIPASPHPFLNWQYANWNATSQASTGTYSPLPDLSNLADATTPVFYFRTKSTSALAVTGVASLPTIGCTISLSSLPFSVFQATTDAKPYNAQWAQGRLQIRSDVSNPDRFKMLIPNASIFKDDEWVEVEVGKWLIDKTSDPAEVTEYANAHGTHGWVQLVFDESFAVLDDSNSTVITQPPLNEWVLDDFVPYGRGSFLLCTNTHNSQLADSPGYGSAGGPSLNAYKKFSVKMQFKSYVMYKPVDNDLANIAGSVFVPTVMCPWTCVGVALKTTSSGTSTWIRDSETSSTSLKEQSPPHPVWTKATIAVP